ncbi:Asp-tRNA(Asn)/Glu-tRNA(Gln) amidotransferase subunit GatA [Spectribacter hydrogenoxidans]|uniref:Glutamyl-tRNA(Gln) amidotransferase subunit A n=1 Tax=Spectribacter hydrogenoxidans TaxID=3075608 RepID=A0ABU3C070_9GAMM|nr:Asp-tRNA(Asn)/Glu-tRNA(Gln) amidotransferase subunit GatA [Salinisphaera sp. W335]MDT0634957.1 Asp-tRNA(Asn)/Glu-tRNA(Gln) amidotransferase subunit GatA [Salinisphaera sp. W335]
MSRLRELAGQLAARKVSAVELTREALARIEQHDAELNALITVCADRALAQAAAADQALAAGASPLAGIPLIHKDIFCTNGVRTSCGSRMLDNFVPPYDATAVEHLDAAGMITLGKANMDEFAMGSSNETSFYGPVRNPWNTDCVPGGSSGGSAAAVAAGLAPAATGTDTGGSIRQPAALCGITGFKPTYGRVSRWGMIAFASSLDQAGCFARSAEDCALLLQAMAGFDERDSTAVDQPVPDYAGALTGDIAGLKIGVPSEYFAEGLDVGTRAAVEAGIKELEAQGAAIVEISLPHTDQAVPTYYVVAPAEASSNLSRFDGVRYGYRCDNPSDLEDLYLRSRGEGFGREVQRRIMVGTYALSAGYYDAYYLKAQKVRRLIADDFRRAFEQVDVIASPTTQGPAFRLGEKLDDPVTMYLNDIYTIPANLAGLPGISVPCGLVNDLPVGMQLLAPWFEEGRLLNAAHAYQQATDWHTRRPAGYE